MGYLLSAKHETIKLEKSKNVLWIILDRPSKLNAFNEALIAKLNVALDEAENDSTVRCVVITGAGDKAFSAGADLDVLSTMTPTKAEEFARMGQKTFAKIEELSKPVIAGINGYALGGGLELALACDFRIASENAELGCSEITFGLIPGWGGTQRLVRIIGVARTKELLLLDNVIKTDEALKIGLINHVVASKIFHKKTAEYAENLCNKSPTALKYIKHAVNFGGQMPFDAGFRLEASLMGLTVSSDEFKKAVKNFKTRKQPASEEK